MIIYRCDMCGKYINRAGEEAKVDISFSASKDEFHVCCECCVELIHKLVTYHDRCGTCHYYSNQNGGVCCWEKRGKKTDPYRSPCIWFKRAGEGE